MKALSDLCLQELSVSPLKSLLPLSTLQQDSGANRKSQLEREWKLVSECRHFGSRSWRRVGHQARNHIAADGGASGCGWSGEPGGDDGQGQKPGAVVAVGAGGTAAVGAADVVAVGTPIPTIPPGPIISFKPAVVP